MTQIDSLENGELMTQSSLCTINPNRSRFRFQKLSIISENRVNICFGRILLFAIVGLAGNMVFSNQAIGWERSTHRELTEKAIEIVASDLNSYLVNNLGLEGGLDASFDGMTAKQWMSEGSDLEDGPFFLSLRPFNHFHNPISNSGLRLGDSAIDWSLAAVGEQSFGHYSWNDAREYYFKALTSETKEERDEYWGKTFRALGQVMHLLQDSANPSHVRDDPHPFDDGLRDFMKRL